MENNDYEAALAVYRKRVHDFGMPYFDTDPEASGWDGRYFLLRDGKGSVIQAIPRAAIEL